jgi:hypothetical protein
MLQRGTAGCTAFAVGAKFRQKEAGKILGRLP